MYSTDEGKMLLGAALNFQDVCWLYPLKIKDIIGMTEEKYDQLLSLLVFNVEDIKDGLRKQGTEEEFLDFSALDYLYMELNYDSTFLLKLQEAFSTFIQEKVHFSVTRKEIIVGNDIQSKRILDETNFEDFQDALRIQNGIPLPERIPVNETEMQKKFRLRREQLKAVKEKQARKSGEIPTLSESIETIICFNIGCTFENVGELTMYQFKVLLKRAQAKYVYDLDMHMIAAGADPKKIKPEIWFGKIKD